jgi:hypothetical protein
MGQGRDQRLCCPITKLDLKLVNTLVVSLKLHFKCMYKRVLPLHPHLLISVIAFRSTLAALIASASPLSFAFGSFIGLRPLLMLGHSTQPCLPGGQRGGDV